MSIAFNNLHVTQEAMVEPWATCDGQSYEKTAIEAWLRIHDASPVTGAVLPSKVLMPNFALRSLLAAQRE